MDNLRAILQAIQTQPFATSVVLGGLSLLVLLFLKQRVIGGLSHSKLPRVPAVPGLPVIGNLLQLKERKPYKTFIAAMVTRSSSTSTRVLTYALKILTFDKCMVAMSDYNEFHKKIKRHILTSLLGANAQVEATPFHREAMMENISRKLNEHVKAFSSSAVNFRNIFASELFQLALKQVSPSFKKNRNTIHLCGGVGSTLSREDIYKILVLDIMDGAIEVDWRDFFPYLKWVPNKSLEMKIQKMYFRRKAVMKALINEQKKRIASGKEEDCYIDYLLSEAKELTEEQVSMLLWESIIESSDTTLVTTEWAMTVSMRR
ncbi:Cytochrome P450 [Sesbania bispinosa]|nr:Cytochrome P450 [Sesbania bispinosa]